MRIAKRRCHPECTPSYIQSDTLSVYANSLLAVYVPLLFVDLARMTHRMHCRLNSRDFLKSQRSSPGNGISGSGRQPSGGQSSSARFTSVQVRSLCSRDVLLIYMTPHRRSLTRAHQHPEAPLKSSSRGTSCAITHCTPETTPVATSATS